MSLEKIYVDCGINRAGQLICLHATLHERDRACVLLTSLHLKGKFNKAIINFIMVDGPVFFNCLKYWLLNEQHLRFTKPFCMILLYDLDNVHSVLQTNYYKTWTQEWQTLSVLQLKIIRWFLNKGGVLIASKDHRGWSSL